MNVENDTTTDASLPRPKIGVCGELVGGSLAAMLALTESHSTKQGVSAAAIGNPVVDWTALPVLEANRASVPASCSTSSPETNATNKRTPPTLEALLTLRGRLFPRAERYHDPFASPLLFFRTASSDLTYETGWQESHGDLNKDQETPDTMKKRRSLRKFPPTGSDLKLPHMRVEVGKDNVLRDQGIELIDLMRRSNDRSELEQPAFQAILPQRRCDLEERQGLGRWYRKEVHEIGEWFGEVLRRPD